MPNASPDRGSAIGRTGDRAAAVVIAGGRAQRFGADKTRALLAGRPLLDHVLAGLPEGLPVVVVGPARPTARPVRWTREEPVHGGPVAALAAGLAALEGPGDDGVDVVVLLAADAPFATTAVPRLLAAVAGRAAAVGTDADGRRQWLVSALRVPDLRAVLPPDPAGASLRSVVGALDAVAVALADAEALDVDEPADVDEAARRLS